jgi:hypothetical protein
MTTTPVRLLRHWSLILALAVMVVDLDVPVSSTGNLAQAGSQIRQVSSVNPRCSSLDIPS